MSDLYPGSIHVRDVGMKDAPDTMVWDHAEKNGFTIVSKDADFQRRNLLLGHPPKFLWLRLGNCPVWPIEELLRKYSAAIHTFEQNATESHLMLP